MVECSNEQTKQKSCSDREDQRIYNLKKERSNERKNLRIYEKTEGRANERTNEHILRYAKMYPYFLFAAIHHQSSPTFSVRPRSSVGRVTVDLIRRSWVRCPPRSKDFFFTSCGSLIPFTRANAQWVIHGFY